MGPVRAFISGCAGPALSTEERRFFEAAQPWGLILFKRNVESPDQLRRLTTEFRDSVGRADALAFSLEAKETEVATVVGARSTARSSVATVPGAVRTAVGSANVVGCPVVATGAVVSTQTT